VGLAALAIFAFSALVSASAFAEAGMEWLENGNAITTNKASDSTGALKLKDTTNNVEVECSGLGAGTVGANGADEITTILTAGGSASIPCTVLNKGTLGCEEPTHAEALNLPWVTQLILVGAEVRDELKAHAGGGSPGWKTECTIFGVFKVAQECTSASGNTAIENVAGGVNATFDAKTANAACTNGDTATVRGTTLNLLTSGATLTQS
jgi:hypothetical protein